MIHRFTRPAALMAALLLVACATGPRASDKALVGAWDVSLNFDPKQPPSKTEMTISAVTNANVQGTFYGSAFVTSTIAHKDGQTMYMAKTTDLTSAYFHEWRMQPNGALSGKTVSPERKFEMTWTAVRKP